MGLLLITRFTLQEVVRRRLFLALLLLNILFLAVYAFLLSAVVDSMASRINTGAEQGLNLALYLLASGVVASVPTMWLVYLQTGLMTILLTAGAVSSEVEAGTFAIIVPKPLRRVEIVMGKWLGNAIMLGVYTALLFFAFSAVIYWKTGYWPVQAIGALSMLELAMLALLGITTLGSTLMSTVVNGAIALVLFIGAPITGFVQFLIIASSNNGTNAPQSDAVQNITAIINLVIPTDALWHGASAYLLPSAATSLMQQQQYSLGGLNVPFISPQPVVLALMLWIVAYIIALPAFATWRFQRRDL